MDWKAILADKSVADDVQVTVGSNTFTMKQLRDANAESEGEVGRRLAARQAELDEKQRLQEQAVNNFATILTKVSETTGLPIEKIISGDVTGARTATTAAATTEPGDDFWNKDEYKPIKAKLDPLENQVKTLVNAVKQVTQHYMNRQMRDDFQSYKMPEGVKDITLEKAIQYAMQNKYVDEVGIPNVRRALDDLTAGVRAKKTEEEIRADEREKAKREFEMAQFAQPQGGAGGIQFDSSPAKGNSKDVVSIKDALDKAWQDTSILQTLRTQ